ncbi:MULTISPECIES: TRAP transporter small permease subunit [Paracoccus]|uniref:TRAP transporter small permease subunit n=1 Tax=Paracoccus TaxID=265 RepID=UPI0025508EE0|nr:TRAP transporter small permease [Paracoccus sp. SSJ]MDK8875326.1 TRAP transporter small permease [Paracoccus sp. SSJ]
MLETTFPETRPFGRIISTIDFLTGIGGYAAALSLLGILGLILAEIFTRNFLASSLHFSWDLAGYLMGACFLLGCGSAMKAGSHVRVTALIEISSPIVGRVLEIASTLVGLAICGALSWALIDMAVLSGQRGSTAATTFRVPLVYPQAVLAAGAVLLTLQCLAQVLRLLRGEALTSGPGLE